MASLRLASPQVSCPSRASIRYAAAARPGASRTQKCAIAERSDERDSALGKIQGLDTLDAPAPSRPEVTYASLSPQADEAGRRPFPTEVFVTKRLRDPLARHAVIPLHHQFCLLSDRNRLTGFRRGIREVVRRSHVVADLGAGLGLLSILAARRGARVYAVEADPDVSRFGRAAVASLGQQIRFINADARSVTLPEKVDVVLCEMVDTALINELQVPVINHALRSLLKPGGTVLPSSAATFVRLISYDFRIEGHSFKAPVMIGHGARSPSAVLSSFALLRTVDFTVVNELEVDTTVSLCARRKGVCNALEFKTQTMVTDQIILSPRSRQRTWLNPPYVLPLPERNVSAGEELRVRVRYEMGAGWQSCRIGFAGRARSVK